MTGGSKGRLPYRLVSAGLGKAPGIISSFCLINRHNSSLKSVEPFYTLASLVFLFLLCWSNPLI